MGLASFYAARGVSLDTLAAASPAEMAFMMGARALYYEEIPALIAQGIAMAFGRGDNHG